jgi:hypothetical protein
MAARKPSKPWAVVLSTPFGPVRTEHRSQPEAYRKINAVREGIASGTSHVTSIRVEQWETDYGQWGHYETLSGDELR